MALQKLTYNISLSESANNALLIHQRGVANRTNSNSLMSTSSDLCRNNSTHSFQSARSTRSNMTAMTTLSSRSGKHKISCVIYNGQLLKGLSVKRHIVIPSIVYRVVSTKYRVIDVMTTLCPQDQVVSKTH